MKDKRFGVCESHKYNENDEKARETFWCVETKMYCCIDCLNDVTIKAMAKVNRDIELKIKGR